MIEVAYLGVKIILFEVLLLFCQSISIISISIRLLQYLFIHLKIIINNVQG